jgi:hypothetical protein
MMIRFLVAVALMALISKTANAIYATQLGQYDWLMRGVGYVKDSIATKGGHLIVSTEDGVLASMNIRDGSLVWRNPLPEGGKVEQFAVSEGSNTNIAYAVISTPCSPDSVDGDNNSSCRMLFVQGWGVEEGTMLFETHLGKITSSSSLSSVYDIAFYEADSSDSQDHQNAAAAAVGGGAGGRGESVVAMAANTLYELDPISGAVTAKWSPKDKSTQLSSLVNRRSSSAGGGGDNVIAIACTASSGSSGAACSKTVLVKRGGSDGESLASAVTLSVAYVGAVVGGVKPAFGVDSESDWVYGVKGNTLSLLSLKTGKVSTIALPAMASGGGGGDNVYVQSFVQDESMAGTTIGAHDEDDNDGEVRGSSGSVMVLRCDGGLGSRAQCQSHTVHFPSEVGSIPFLSDTSLTCGGGGSSSSSSSADAKKSQKSTFNDSNNAAARMGAGRGPRSRHEGQGEATLFCVSSSSSSDSNGGDATHGISVSVLDSEDGKSSAGANSMIVPTAGLYGFSGFFHASCNLVLNRKGRRVAAAAAASAEAASPALCLVVTSAGTTMALKKSAASSSSSSSSALQLLWTREEALSGATQAALYSPPSSSETNSGDDSSSGSSSSGGGGKSIDMVSILHKIDSFVTEKLLPVLADPLKAVFNAGDSLSAKGASGALAELQARAYGFDKVAVFLTDGSGHRARTVVAMDVSTEKVMWINELPPVSGTGEGVITAEKLVRIADSTVAVVTSVSGNNNKVGTTFLELDILTGKVSNEHGAASFLAGYYVLGMYPLGTSLATSLNMLGSTTDSAAASGTDGATSAHGHGTTHVLLLQHTGSATKGGGGGAEALGVTTYPFSSGDSSAAAAVGMYLSRVVDGSSGSSSGSGSKFESYKVLSTNKVVTPACTSVSDASGSDNTCKSTVFGVAVHAVEEVAVSVFSSAASETAATAGGDSSGSGAGRVVVNEKVAAVAFQHPDDIVNNRAATLGDDSLLMKYLNPAAALVITEHTLQAAEAKKGESTGSSGASKSQLEIHLFDSVSAKLLYRSSIPHGGSPVHAVVVENNLVITYWNTVMKRTELSSVALFEGMIDKAGLTPWAAKSSKAIAQKHIDTVSFNSFTAPLPMAIQKTFVLPKSVSAAGATITRQGVAKKAILIGTTGGQVFSIDRQMINPRRPIDDPTTAEKADGLFKYEPFLALDTLQSPTHNYSMAFGPFSVISAATDLESSSVTLSISRLDVHFNRVIPSLAFDLLSPDFNYPLLCVILTALFVLVAWMKEKLAARKKSRAWQ